MGTVLLVLGNEIGSGLDGTWTFTGTPSDRLDTTTEPRPRNVDSLPVDGSNGKPEGPDLQVGTWVGTR